MADNPLLSSLVAASTARRPLGIQGFAYQQPQPMLSPIGQPQPTPWSGGGPVTAAPNERRSLGSYAAWDPLRAAAQRRTSVNPTRVSMTRPGALQALQRASAPSTQQQPAQQTATLLGGGYGSYGYGAQGSKSPVQQPTQESWLHGYWLPQQPTPQQPTWKNLGVTSHPVGTEQGIGRETYQQPTQQTATEPFKNTRAVWAPMPQQQPTSTPWSGIHSPDVPPASTRQGGSIGVPVPPGDWDAYERSIVRPGTHIDAYLAQQQQPATQPAMKTGWWQGYGTPFGNSSGAGYLQQMVNSGNLNPALTQGITR